MLTKKLVTGLALTPLLCAVGGHAQSPPSAKPNPKSNPPALESKKMTREQAQPNLPLFYKKLELLDTKKHKTLAVAKESTDLSYASQANIIPIAVTELSFASKHYPLVFVAEENSPAPTLVAMVGLGDNKNLFVDAKGKWRAGVYVPAWVRRYPFLTVKAEQNREAIAFDPTAKLFAGKNNLPLFENDQPTETLKRIVAFQNEFNAAFEQTAAMARALQEAGVLEPATLRLGSPEKEKAGRNITGFLVVNEAKLRGLDAAAVAKLHQANALGLAYAQLLSLANLQTLGPVTK
jgi:hypothetical protein